MNKGLKAALAIGAAAAALAGCSVREARIAMPSDLAAQTERLELRGMGGGQRGRFTLGASSGSFARSAERLGIFDPMLVRRSGGGGFELVGPEVGGALSARCRYREREVNLAFVSLMPERLAYSCGFRRDDRPIAAELALHDPAPATGTLHGRSERLGILHYEGREIGIASIHRDRSGGLPSPTALGYMFSENGREIGAVDLNGGTVHAPRELRQREAVIAASLALAIFWDPAMVSE